MTLMPGNMNMIRRLPVACRRIIPEPNSCITRSAYQWPNRPTIINGYQQREIARISLRCFSSAEGNTNAATSSILSPSSVPTAKIPGQATHNPPSYKVAKVGMDGSIVMNSLLLSEILSKSSNVYARDLFSLSLTSKQERYRHHHGAPRRPVSVILPRGEEVLVSFGNLRAMIAINSVLIFDAHNVNTKQFARDLARTLEKKSSKQISCDNAKPTIFQYADEPFELIILEEILQDACDGFNRRIRLYEPIVDSLLNKVSSEIFSDSGVHLLPPLKDSLQSFEMQVRQSRDCLMELLGNDDDMLGLLITQQHEAQSAGREVPRSRHADVELILEEYARQLNNTLFEIQFLLQRLQSKQEFVALALSGYRNRLIRMNLYLGITGLTFGIGTTVAGFYGMNLINGFEHHPYMFQVVVASTVGVGIAVFGGCMNYVSGKTMQKRAAQRIFEIETLNSALSDMCALDFTVKTALDKGEPLSKDHFRKELKRARLSGTVSDAEVDLLFGAMDASKDGLLHHDDFLGFGKIGLTPNEKRWRPQ